MANKITYVGVGDKARKARAIYVGVNGVARKVTNAYAGVNGVAKKVYNSYVPVYAYTTETYSLGFNKTAGQNTSYALESNFYLNHPIVDNDWSYSVSYSFTYGSNVSGSRQVYLASNSAVHLYEILNYQRIGSVFDKDYRLQGTVTMTVRYKYQVS